MTSIGDSFGKLILLGEHAVIYGSPAVGLGLPCRLRVTFKPNEGASMTCHGMDETDAAVLRETLELAAEEGHPAVSGQWCITSNIPRSGGFGSSSALCVAVARVLTRNNHPRYNVTVHRLSNRLEKKFHGNPSGLDTGLSSSPGLSAWAMKKDDVPEPLPMKMPPLHLLYGALPRRANTAAAINKMRQNYESDGGKTSSMIGELGEITTSFIRLIHSRKGIRDRNFHLQAANAINRSQFLLRDMGFSTEGINELLDIAQGHGAIAGKMSGAGMGGAFFLLVPDAQSQARLLETLPNHLTQKGIMLSVPLRAITADSTRT